MGQRDREREKFSRERCCWCHQPLSGADKDYYERKLLLGSTNFSAGNQRACIPCLEDMSMKINDSIPKDENDEGKWIELLPEIEAEQIDEDEDDE